MYQEESVLPLNEDSYVIEPNDSSQCSNCKISSNLFDRDGTIIAKRLSGWLPHNSSLGTFIDRILLSPTCFSLSVRSYGNQGIDIKNVHFFETLLVIEHKPSHVRDFTCYPHDHSLSHEMLYTIKYFQLTLGNAKDECSTMLSHLGNFGVGYNLHKFRPELFKSQSPEKVIFDKKTKSDKLKIELDQKEIQTKIEINKKIQIDLEQKEIQIKEQETKLLEEKRKLFAVKQKLDLMKQELQLERDEFENEKRKHEIKNIDLDDYFEIPVATIVSPTIGEMILGQFVDL